MLSKVTSESKKINALFSDHTTFLQKRRELYLESQKYSRLSILEKSRNIEIFLSDFDEDITQKDLNILAPTEISKEVPTLAFNSLNLIDEEIKSNSDSD